jgi:hypothetical protein
MPQDFPLFCKRLRTWCRFGLHLERGAGRKQVTRRMQRHDMRRFKMNISDVMIHINEPLDEEARSALENAMLKIEGVVSPRFNAGKAHLLMVAYDTEKTSTAALLDQTLAAGYTAQLVGM